MAEQTHIKIAGAWKACTNVWTKAGGVWKSSSIPKVKVSGAFKNAMSYGFTETSIIRQGYLYNWYVTQLDIAPIGYRVPSYLDWAKLQNLPTRNVRTTGTEWSYYNTHPGYDLYNFSAIPVPQLYLSYPYDWSYQSDYGFFWTNEGDGTSGYSYSIGNTSSSFFTQNWKSNVLAIRCCRNATAEEINTKFNGEVIEQVTDYDGNVYDAIKINDLIWLRQNLATTRDNSGTYISHKTTGDTAAQTYAVYVQPNFSSTNVFFVDVASSWWKHIDNKPLVPGLKQHYGGGLVGYIYGPYDSTYVAGEVHGLIISFNETGYRTGVGYAWGIPGVYVDGAWGGGFGDGAQNTIDMYNGVALGTVNDYDQAPYIYDLVENGYSDWFLPSRLELARIIQANAFSHGGRQYMTSTQYDANSYWSYGTSYHETAISKSYDRSYGKPTRYF